MKISTMIFPERIVYGPGSLSNIGEEAKKEGNRVLIVSDNMMKKLGYLETCEKALQESGLHTAAFLDIETEPTDKYVEKALEMVQQENADVIVALGGGSCIDTAKAVAVLATNEGAIKDYMNNKKTAAHKALPLIAVPTTAGTGSEATDVTVITNTADGVKMMIKQPAFMPKAAIIDSQLSMSSPKSIKAATGMDALTHSIEAYISKKAHVFSDQLALSSAKLIMHNILKSYEDKDDTHAAEQMALGAMQGGMAFSNASVCLVHGMSRPIGAMFHVPHGISNAMLLPVILEYSSESCQSRLSELAAFIYPEWAGLPEEEAADRFVQKVLELCQKLEIPNMKGWGIEEGAYHEVLEKMAADALESGSPGNNPIVPSEKNIIALYEKAYVYEYTK